MVNKRRLTVDVKQSITHLQKKMLSCSIEEFMQYFTGTLVLVVGLFLLALNANSFARKIFFHGLIMDIKTDTTFFAMPASMFCIPCFFLTIFLKLNKGRLFFMLVGLQSMAVIILIAGYSLGTKYQPKFSNDTLRLGSTIPKEYINNTLYKLIIEYENNTDYKSSVDKIQSTLRCCGVYSTNDFNTVPISCCRMTDCQQNKPYQAGCLRRVQEDIAWHKNVTVSLAPLAILLYLFNGTMAVSVYVSYYYRWKDSTLLDEETHRKYTE